MKVLIVNKFLFPNGGSESYIFRLGEELERAGCEVQYFGMEHGGRIVGNRAQSYTSEIDFHAPGVRKFLAPFRLLYSWEARRKLRAVLEDMRPDAVHLNNINFQLTPSVIEEVRAFDKKNGRKTYLFITAHDSQWMCPGHLLRIPSTGELCRRCVDGSVWNCAKYRCIHDSRARSLLGSMEGALYRMKKTYGLVDAVICPSEFMKEILSHHPRLRDKCVVLHNFVGAGDTETGFTADRESAERYVLYFGRYGEEKGIRDMLGAASIDTEIPFVLAGRGELQSEVDDAVKNAALLPDGTPHIRDVGFKSGDELAALIRGAAFVVFPSVCHENCPLSLMEAQSAGVPVIASALGGIPELMEDDGTGELVPAGDVQLLAERIRSLWNDTGRCRRYSERARSFAKERYPDPAGYTQELIKMIGSSE